MVVGRSKKETPRKRNEEMGEKRERELYGNILYYFNELYGKIESEIMSIL